MYSRRIALTLAVLLAALLLGGCYQELAVRDFSKAGQQNLEGWHLFPFSDLSFTDKGMALGRATFSLPLELDGDFEVKTDIIAELSDRDLPELGICLSSEKIYMSPLGTNAIIRTELAGGAGRYDAYSVNYVVKQHTFASGNELLPGFRPSGKNVMVLWRKAGEFGWTMNGKKSGPFKLPAELSGRVYVHFNVNAGSSSQRGITIVKVRASGPKDSARAW